MEIFMIDRIEGEYAVCETENKEIINIPLADLPSEVKEGDYIYKDEKGQYNVDIFQTQNVKERIQKKLDDLWE